jgi:hypothetical protein
MKTKTNIRTKIKRKIKRKTKGKTKKNNKNNKNNKYNKYKRITKKVHGGKGVPEYINTSNYNASTQSIYDNIINRIGVIRNTIITMDNYENIISELSYLYDEAIHNNFVDLYREINELEQNVIQQINELHQ